MVNSKKIDAVDAKILKTLLLESRTSFTEIAKSCKISVCAVRMRYNRLKKAGIITGENMHLNPKFWGFDYTADIRVKAALSDEEEVLEMLRNKRYVLIANNFGNIIMGLIVLPKLEDLRRIIEEIEANPKIKHVDTLIWSQAQNVFYPENLIIKPFVDLVEKKETLKTTIAKPEEVHIDEIDRQIARIIANNSRTSFSKIAKQLNISTHNVIQRYRKLRKGNVLTCSAISISLSKLGYNALHVSFLKLEAKSKVSEIREQLLQIPNALFLVEHVGPYDLRIDIAVADVEEIFRTTERIRRINGIEKVDTRIMRCVPQFPEPLYNKLVSY